ncbi:hypothetical protein [Morganella sp. GD04133]|uniref:hypothetical protein n=1 Tax=Morganella sp. GD04133 TaxID=2975435 RepID=UPI002447DF3B|nr:hypothetical protein [Morganella sp. GD04133]MDH0355695.1 hypothetical protein [Morganella sp. GD04133]
MKKIGDVTSTADKNGEWTNGNVAAGIVPTILDAAWLNSVQREILGVLTKAGVPQDKNNDTQLAEAIGRIIGNGDYVTHPYLKLELLKKIDKADIAQQLGNDTGKVVSQQLLTTELGKKAGITDVSGKLDKTAVVQVPGASTTSVMSQKAVTDLANTKADGDRFSTRTSAVLMSSPNGNYGVEISNTGMFAVADLSGAAPVPIFRVTPTGEINDGAIALAKVTGAGTAAKSDILQTTGASTANVMSQKAVTDAVAAIKVFGAGQRWSDVKSTRNLGVNYTNTSGRTIALFASTVPALAMASLVIYVDGVTVSNSGTGGSDSGFTRMASGSAIIPAGSTYRVEANSLDKWSELR